jgi:hypothetical protein
MSQLATELYLPKVAAARQRLETDAALAKLLDPRIAARQLHLFAIQWCAHGVHTTAPVESWIRRAGEACCVMGLVEVGSLLRDHARHEAGHESMMIHDAHCLVEQWNRKYPEPLNAERILAQKPLATTQRYAELHEKTIAGDAPFAQIAIELEIERLSTTLGPALMAQFHARLGNEIAGELTFLPEHIVLDVGHTRYNTRLLEMCLSMRPEAAEIIALTGSNALHAYLDFLDECFNTAEALLESVA